MENKLFNKEDLDSILTELNYFENFHENFLNRQYHGIDYGSKIGILNFDSLFDAARKYTYSNHLSENIFIDWNKILNNENSSNEELLCTVLEIFVWGNVLRGNVKTAIHLYKDKKLKPFLRQTIQHLRKKEILSKANTNELIKFEIIWSSGWTKVYSFINNDILIYDSRVSAFLNHTLTYDIAYNEEQLIELKKLTKYLFNFQGAEKRERLVDKERYDFKNSNPKGLNGFNSNLISSWIIELLKEKLEINQDIRLFERAFFMLGFDLKQIKVQHNTNELQEEIL